MQNGDQQPLSAPPPACRHQEATRALPPSCLTHGKPLRGLMSTAKSNKLDGRFGRMFNLPAAKWGATDAESRINLMTLGDLMTSTLDKPKDGFDGEESGIPALYTYFGQFVDHDITFDPVTTLVRNFDPDALTDFRTPALDMDNVYGRGPGDQPYLYDSDGMKFLLGEPMHNDVPDLPRNKADPARAIIGDPRNDENSIVSQLQGLMLLFHNRVVDDNPDLDFMSIQRIVRYHYQYVVVNDFLSRIVNKRVLDGLKTDGQYDSDKIKFFQWKYHTHMPVEFAAAAYRLGHSMVRPGYRLNKNTLLPIFPVADLTMGLTGFRAMVPSWGIDWGCFIDVGDPRQYGEDPDKQDPATDHMKERLQFAYRLDTSMVNPLGGMPDTVAPDHPRNLATRNLLRGYELGLPSGQSIAKAMGVVPLTDDEIVIGKAVDGDPEGPGAVSKVKDLKPFKGNCPLWAYILAEAANVKNRIAVEIPVVPPKDCTLPFCVNTPQLGDVGGRIVAEVFLGMLFRDPDSFLSCDPAWVPTIGNAKYDFKLRDIVAYASRMDKTASAPVNATANAAVPEAVAPVPVPVAAPAVANESKTAATIVLKTPDVDVTVQKLGVA